MKIIIKLKEVLIAFLLLVFCFSTVVFAKGVTVELLGTNFVFKCKDNGYQIDAGDKIPEQTNIHFITSITPPTGQEQSANLAAAVNGGTGQVGGSNLDGVDPGVGQFKYGDDGTFGGNIYVRVWWQDTGGQWWYGNSQPKYINPSQQAASEPWSVSSFPQVYDPANPPANVPKGALGIHFYKWKAPDAPTIDSVDAPVLTGYSTDMDPKYIISGYFDLKLYELANTNGGEYEYEVIGGVDAIPSSGGSVSYKDATEQGGFSFELTLEPDTDYTVKVWGNNYFAEGPKAETTFHTVAGGTVSLDPGIITLRNGINFISMPFMRNVDDGVEWYAYDMNDDAILFDKNGQQTNKVENIRDLINAINARATVNVVSTVGRWVEDGQGGPTSDKGVLLEDKNIGNPIKGAAHLNDILSAEEGYQVYVDGLAGDLQDDDDIEAGIQMKISITNLSPAEEI